MTSEGEEVLKRIQNYKGVTGLIIVNKEGVPVRSTMDNSTSVQYAAHFRSISDQAKHCVRDIDPLNELTFFRIRSKKYEVMVAPESKTCELCADNEYLVVVMQSPIN